MAPFADLVGKKTQSMFTDTLPPGSFIVVHRSFAKSRWKITAVERHDV